MENSLEIRRVQLSFDETNAEWLKQRSDQHGAEGTICSVLVSSASALSALMDELRENLGIPDSFAAETISGYPASFFETGSLIVMFSDERSGSNRLTLKEECLSGDTICLTLRRQRGLTMDMAYLFLFYPTDQKQAVRSKVMIEEAYSL